MSFKSYAQTIQPDGRWMLSDPRPLLFSGPNGLIAQFVTREKERATVAWKLSPDELHVLARIACASDEPAARAVFRSGDVPVAVGERTATGTSPLLETAVLALPGEIGRERVIVFEQTDGAALELMWLQNVRGISAETTEMLFSFTPLRVEMVKPLLLVKAPNAACAYGEDLTLDGGVSNLQGTWKWKKPHLALGGVKLGPAPVVDRTFTLKT